MVDQDSLLLSLVYRAKNGDDLAFKQILDILDSDIKKLSAKYYISGSDIQDVIQECRIGIWKAVRDYTNEGGMSFKNFSINLCCKRHIITAMAHANRKKFDLHNNSVSLDSPVMTGDDDLQQTLADFVCEKGDDLLQKLIFQEEYEENMRIMEEKLTPLESDILTQYAHNDSYKEIAQSLGCKPKTVDNALMRIRKKAVDIYQSYQVADSLGFSTDNYNSFGGTYLAFVYNAIGVMTTGSSPRPKLLF